MEEVGLAGLLKEEECLTKPHGGREGGWIWLSKQTRHKELWRGICNVHSRLEK